MAKRKKSIGGVMRTMKSGKLKMHSKTSVASTVSRMLK